MTIQALLISPSMPGGEGVYSRTLAECPPPGVHYSVAAISHQHAPGARCNVPVEAMLNRGVRRVTFPDAGFRAMRLTDRFDLVHVHAHPVLLRGRDGAPLVMSEGSSSAVYLGEYLGWDRDRVATRYRRARRIYRALRLDDRLLAQERAARVYVFSNWARSLNLEWGADPDKTEVVYPGFPTPPPVDRTDRATFRFLFVGTDFERKGGFEVVEALSEVVAQSPGARLTVVAPDPAIPNPDRRAHSWVGPGRRARVLAKLAELMDAGLLDVCPPVGRERLYAEHYPAADAFVMPSHAEGFGFTNVEAMGFGLPVISSTAGPIPEVVADGVTGRLVPPGGVDALTEAMLEFAVDPRRARSLGDAGRRAFLSRFTLERFRAELGDLYRRVLSG